MSELPTITDPIGFCMCLEISLSHCQQIRSNYEGNLKDQTTQIAAVWYRKSTEPRWDMVVEALFCFQRNRDAVQLANKMGLDWKPLQKKNTVVK